MSESKGGKLGPRYGRKIRARVNEVEKKQRVKQECPKCGKSSKRVGSGIFECPNCGKFTGGAYYV
jgi:large subunit ribosomal protein L37Ae